MLSTWWLQSFPMSKPDGVASVGSAGVAVPEFGTPAMAELFMLTSGTRLSTSELAKFI